jgi:predicted Rossmann fold nucleotide-binding protein DprA/Smf involved in DNA uptake
MTLSPNTQAILLLTTRFPKGKGGASDEVSPLTPREWGRFAEWLKLQALQPQDLLDEEAHERLQGWHDTAIPAKRLLALLNRGSALALALEKWLRAGLWVMTRADTDYPRRLKQRLRNESPAVLFGCGDRGLLNAGGLAVVGSRNADEDALGYTRRLGQQAAGGSINLVSGAARGIDETAMLAGLDAGGTAVGVMADSLLRASASAKYRPWLQAGTLALVTPFSPEAGFNAGNAMQRNKYIYCLADTALVVHSGKQGGTWTGAQENLRQAWVPLWVRDIQDSEAGNALLIKAGAMQAADLSELDVASLCTNTVISTRQTSLELPGLAVGEERNNY